VTPAPEERLRVLIEEFTPVVGAYLRRRSYPLVDADIDELVQTVFVVAWRRIDDVPHGAERPWLIGVARNVLSNARRSNSRRSALHARITPNSHEPSAEETVLASDRLRSAFMSLSASDRELLLLHYWDGLESPELAIVLKIAAGAASTRLSRASSRLRVNFESLGDGSVKSDVDRT
jgi:RNA polymerase sigma-70 factor (ECF subfamily)